VNGRENVSQKVVVRSDVIIDNNNNDNNNNNNNKKIYIGIDVLKYKLDIYNSKTGEYNTIKNNELNTIEFIKISLLIYNNHY
jgi:hypothetical protein